MTTIENETVTPKKKRKILLPIVAVIIVLGIAAFVVSRAGFDKALVKQKLDEYIAAIEEKSREQGRDVKITYGDLDVAGSFTSRHIVIHSVSVALKPLAQQPVQPDAPHHDDSLIITTPELLVYPKAVDLSSALISIPQPIDFASQEAPDKSLLKLASKEPLEATISQETIDQVQHTKVSHTAPSGVDFTYLREQQASGTEDKSPNLTPVYDTLHVTIGAGSTITSDFTADGSGVGKADTSYKTISMAPESNPQAVITVEKIENHWSNTLNEQKHNLIHATANIGPVVGTPDVLPYSPIALKLDLSYDGAIGNRSAEAIANAGAQDPTIVLKQFALTTKDASVTADANFTASPTDILPVGKANLNITSIQFVLGELRKYMLLNPQNEVWVDALIEQIAGAPLATLKDVQVPIERSHGGAFKIGKSTFEELLAVVLKSAISQRAGIPSAPLGTAPATLGAPVEPGAPAVSPTKTVPVPNLPAADKPKSAPIAVPDNGVRG